jgi:hypothetical protein
MNWGTLYLESCIETEKLEIGATTQVGAQCRGFNDNLLR